MNAVLINLERAIGMGLKPNPAKRLRYYDEKGFIRLIIGLFDLELYILRIGQKKIYIAKGYRNPDKIIAYIETENDDLIRKALNEFYIKPTEKNPEDLLDLLEL